MLLDEVSKFVLKNCWLLAVGILIVLNFFIIFVGVLFLNFFGGGVVLLLSVGFFFEALLRVPGLNLCRKY